VGFRRRLSRMRMRRFADVEGYYGPMGVACSYEGLRGTIGRRYLAGRVDWDAETIFLKYRHLEYVSCNNVYGGGDSLGGDGGSHGSGH
jgi:hypothetical protein